jgi:hypothetical protein
LTLGLGEVMHFYINIGILYFIDGKREITASDMMVLGVD